ncbi:MAG: hypothetical protein ABII26_01250 [Pseudomonadota bacterium]
MDRNTIMKIEAEFYRVLPRVHQWIDDYIKAHLSLAVPVADLGFPREVMAYELQRAFESGVQIPQLGQRVRDKTVLVAKDLGQQPVTMDGYSPSPS